MHEHTVWHIYDELRTAKLNLCYYRARLARSQRWLTIQEVIMAAAGSTGVAGLWFLDGPPGDVFWKTLSSVSAGIAVYHSVTRPSEAVRTLETHVTGWGRLVHALSDVRRRIHERGAYDEGLRGEVKAILDGAVELTATGGDASVDSELLQQCFDQVKRELPPEVFFVPKDRA